MDNMSIKDVVLESKISKYNTNSNDFKASQELTVEITLSEYRALVSSNATKEQAIKEAESDRYERENEIKTLKAQVEALKAENYELKKQAENATREEET